MKKNFLFLALIFVSYLTGFAQVKKIHGLAVIADFDDSKHAISDATVDSLLNQRAGYNKSNNAGSLYEYFKDQTNGKYEVTHTVVRVRFNKNKSYFSGANNPDTGKPWDYGQSFADSVLLRVKKLYPDGIPGLTRYLDGPTNGIGSWLILQTFNTSAFGVSTGQTLRSGNEYIPMNHVALATLGVGTETNHILRMISHECAHAIFRLPDVGNQKGESILKKNGHAGAYCMMGWNAGGQAQAVDFCPPLLETFNTANIVEISDNQLVDLTISLKSNARDTVFKYKNPRNANEYFLIQSNYTSKWYPALNLANDPYHNGLAIWHVVADGTKNPWMRIVQADGRDLMNQLPKISDRVATGTDNRIFFGSVVKTVNGQSNPMFRWLDGSIPGLYITEISNPGQRMTFKVATRYGKLLTSIASGEGTFSSNNTHALGTIELRQGLPTTINIIPDYGYLIDNVIVDGVSQGSISSYTFNTPGQSHTLTASFKFSVPKISPFTPGAFWRIESVSSESGSDVASKAIDNNTNTYWQSNGVNNFLHQLVVNMGTNYMLSGIGLTNRSNFTNSINRFDVFVSLDGDNWQQVSNGKVLNTVNNNNRIIGFKPVLARYFKVVTKSSLTGSNAASIAEVEAYGTRYAGLPILNDAEISKANWRINAASSVQSGMPASNLIDNNVNTIWHTQISPLRISYPHNVDIDLGVTYNISRFRLLPAAAIEDARISKYAIFVSNDGVNWGDTVSTGIWDNTASEKVVYFPPVTARYLRLTAMSEASAGNSASGSEVYIHGNLATSVKSLSDKNDFLKVYAGENSVVVETTKQISFIKINDALGRLVFGGKLEVGKHTLPISVKSGVYIVNVVADGEFRSKKLLFSNGIY